MQPIAPFLTASPAEPNVELLRRHGWAVNSQSGSYCVAFRGQDEAVFRWRDGSWRRVGGHAGDDI